MTTDSTRALVAQLKAALEILAIGAHRRKLQEEAAYGPCFSATRVERARDEYKAVKDAIAAADRWLESPPTNQCGETCERAKLCATCARGLEPLTDGQIVECFVRAGCSGIRKTTYESGPYDITNPTLDGINIVRAIERAHGIAK